MSGCPTGQATSWKANSENYSRHSLIKWYQFLLIQQEQYYLILIIALKAKTLLKKRF